MTFTSLDSMGKTNLMLDLISQRQRALGSNVANVDTPGYVRRDIDFSSYLGTMNSPLETKLSTELGPSGILEDRRTYRNAEKRFTIHYGNEKNVKYNNRNENCY